jgi:hypothetical protein
MRSLTEPILMGRSFLAWINFLLMILILIVASTQDTRWILMLDMFWAGCLFVMWFRDREFIFWINEAIWANKLNAELLKMLKQKTGGKDANTSSKMRQVRKG